MLQTAAWIAVANLVHVCVCMCNDMRHSGDARLLGEKIVICHST